MINDSKGTVVAREYRLCRSVLSKAKGFMFTMKKKYALLFDFSREQIVSIHNLFVFFSIDIIWLDKDRRVVDLRENFKPFTPLALPKKPAKYIIEAAAGAIENSRTEVGDIIRW